MIDDDERMETIRRQGRRLAWLMAGAAIGLAVVLLVVVVAAVAVGVGPVVGPASGTDEGAGSALGGAGAAWLIAGASLLLAALLGLVPGVRELEVTGARGMLGAEGELLLPRRPRAGHHVRTALWVVLHLGSGLLCAMLLATFVPSAVLFLVELATGGPLGTGLPLPDGGIGRLGAAVLALLVGAAAALAWWPLGAVLARLAPHLLGPTATDRLEAAEQRMAHEAERTRIARELHDGIGHALTVVSVQAAAARTVQHRDPEAAAAALAAIEETARDATGELDAVLALLREEGEDRRTPHRGIGGAGRRDGEAQPARSTPGPTGAPAEVGASLEALLASHRDTGMDLRRRGEVPADLAPLARRHLTAALGELLTNARRHAAPGPVTVAVSEDGGVLQLEVTSALAASGESGSLEGADGTGRIDRVEGADPADGTDSADGTGGTASSVARRRGHGLVGLRERADLLGGTLDAGPRGDVWVARLDLPLLREEER